MWGFPKIRGTIWGSHQKACTILGSTLRSPCLGKLPCKVECLGFRDFSIVAGMHRLEDLGFVV